MILPASTGSTAPPVACSSSPTMATISIANQFNRKPTHPPTQQQLSCLPTMDNYNPFSTIINQVKYLKKNIFIDYFNTLFS
jgi:hypothetical protein